MRLKSVTHTKTYCIANIHDKSSPLDHCFVKCIDCLLGTPRVHVLEEGRQHDTVV